MPIPEKEKKTQSDKIQIGRNTFRCTIKFNLIIKPNERETEQCENKGTSFKCNWKLTFICKLVWIEMWNAQIGRFQEQNQQLLCGLVPFNVNSIY